MLKTAPIHRGCQRCEFGRQRGGLHIGGLEKAVVVGQLQHLAVRGVGEFAPAIAHIDAPQTAHAVEDFVALGVPDVNAFGAGDHARATAIEVLEIGEGMQKMRAVHRLDGACVNGGIHGNALGINQKKAGGSASDVQQQVLALPG